MMNQTSTTNRPKLPPKAFDLEYSTQYRKEVEYLKSKGINYTFIKLTKDYGVPTYKYTKTPELFRAVADFYEQKQLDKEFTRYHEENDKKVQEQICWNAVMHQ